MQYNFITESNDSTISNIFFIKHQKIICFIISGFFSLLFLLYIITFCIFLCSNLKKSSRIYIYWCDFGVSLFLCASFCISFFISLFRVKSENRNENWSHNANERTISIILYMDLMILMIVVTNNIIFDLINFILLSSTINKVAKLRPNDVTDMSKKFEKINIPSLVGTKRHCYEMLISGFLSIALSVFYFYHFMGNRETSQFLCSLIIRLPTKNYCGLRLFIRVFRNLQTVVIIMLFLCIFFNKYFKKKILDNNYHFQNLIMQKIYNENSSQLVSFSDFIIFKSISDFLSNVPLIIFFLLGRLWTYPLIFSFFCMYFHLVLSGALFLHVYKKNSVIPSIVQKLFFLNYFAFHFGRKEKKRTFNEFDFRVTENEYEALREMKSIKILDVDCSVNESLIKEECHKSKKIELDLKTESDYFLIFKLIYYFYDKNKNIYRENELKMEDEGVPFKTLQNLFPQNPNMKLNWKDSRMSNNFVELVRSMSRISLTNQNKLNTSFQVLSENIFRSMEEKEYLDEFKYTHKIKNFTPVKFRIEALDSEIFFQLFPFFQINIDDLLYSLHPSRNKQTIKKFVQTQDTKKNSLSPLIFSKNTFYTHDSFIQFETFEYEDYVYQEHHEFNVKYKDYLLEVIKNLDYTFLPLIIGVFTINFKEKYKVIVLYRHPLSLITITNFNHWLCFEVTEGKEKLRISANHSDVINFNEIEVKNNLKLERGDYEELEKNLENDFKFITNLPKMNLFPTINLFIGNEITKRSKGDVIGSVNTLNMSEGSIQNHSFNSLLKAPFLFGEQNNSQQKRYLKEKGSEIVSLFEKELYIYTGVNRYSIKIYFSNFFRKSSDGNRREHNLSLTLDSERYCEYIQTQLLSYFSKSKDFFNISTSS